MEYCVNKNRLVVIEKGDRAVKLDRLFLNYGIMIRLRRYL